jgi:hypothetical protein
MTVKRLPIAVLTAAFLAPVACSAQSKPSPAKADEKTPVNAPAPVLADFKARIDKYVELRKKADDSAPPLKTSNDPAKIKLAQQGLAERIGAARVGVKQGEIFAPEIAATFRKLLRPEAKEPGTKAMMQEDKPVVVSFKVNGPYPDKEPVATVPPNILATLPSLPEGIEYRFIEKHLILRDAHANLIIDYLPNAIA